MRMKRQIWITHGSPCLKFRAEICSFPKMKVHFYSSLFISRVRGSKKINWLVNIPNRITHCTCNNYYVFVALEFEFRYALDIDAEMRELWSIEWCGVLRCVLGVCHLCFAIILIRESKKFNLGKRTKYSPEAHCESPQGVQREETQDKRR